VDREPTHVRIEADDPLHPKVFLNDQPVEQHLSRVTVDIKAGEPPQMYLELRRRAESVFDGEAYPVIVREVPADPQAEVLSFLRALDPEELDKALLEQFGGLSGDTTTGQACLNVLRAWAGDDD
jgi:hypothetical protein